MISRRFMVGRCDNSMRAALASIFYALRNSISFLNLNARRITGSTCTDQMSHRTDPIILPLPAATTSLLRSNLVIPSLPSIFVELLQNSIDADSTTIALFVDLNRWTIKCADDGRGIEWDRAAATMAVGERYWSSKAATEGMNRVETFGFRGEALASMADIALLEVLTRPRRTQKEDAEAEAEGESYSLIVRGGTKLAEGRAKRKRSSTGTTVWVREIFYKVCYFVYPQVMRPNADQVDPERVEISILSDVDHSRRLPRKSL